MGDGDSVVFKQTKAVAWKPFLILKLWCWIVPAPVVHIRSFEQASRMCTFAAFLEHASRCAALHRTRVARAEDSPSNVGFLGSRLLQNLPYSCFFTSLPAQ